MKEVFACYKSDGIKLTKILNQKKDLGYIVSSLDFLDGLVTVTFEKYDKKNFVYSIDYSTRYYNSINENNEYFDIARMKGWRLQYVMEGMGIWVNENVEDAIPFFLDEEYQNIANDDYKKRMKSMKITFVINTVCSIMIAIGLLLGRGLYVLYGLPFALIYYYAIYNVFKEKKEYPKIIMEVLTNCFLYSIWIYKNVDFKYAIITEIVNIMICLSLLKEGSFIIKKRLISLIYTYWVIFFIILVIFGG